MPPKILVVDDERHIVRLIQVNLERAGYEVVTASSGKDALEKVDMEKPDLIILDLVMPEMDGFEVVQNLRRKPVTHELPAVILKKKASNMDLFYNAEGRLQLHGWMSRTEYSYMKPFDPAELVAVVKRILWDQDGLEVDAARPKSVPDVPEQPVSWWMKTRRLFF